MKPKPQQIASYRETSNLDDPLLDRTAAAEQMSKQMEDSYYYASFQAKWSRTKLEQIDAYITYQEQSIEKNPL